VLDATPALVAEGENTGRKRDDEVQVPRSARERKHDYTPALEKLEFHGRAGRFASSSSSSFRVHAGRTRAGVTLGEGA